MPPGVTAGVRAVVVGDLNTGPGYPVGPVGPNVVVLPPPFVRRINPPFATTL